MSQLNKSKWFGKNRINVDSDLLVESTKGVTISDSAIYTGASNLAVSFFVEAKTLVGDCLVKGTTTLTIAQLELIVDKKTHIHINSNGDWWKNKVKQTGTLIRDWTVVGDINVGKTNSPEFIMSHLVFYDKTLTEKEIDYIHTNGGIIPTSVHESVICHYSLSDKSIFVI